MDNIENKEVVALKRKLAETEARVISRIIYSIQKCLSKDDFEKVVIEFEHNAALDLLEMERNIAGLSKEISDSLQCIHKSAKNFKDAKKEYDDILSRNDMSLINEAQEKHDIMMNAMMNLFSSIDEYAIRKSFQKTNTVS